MRQIAFSGVPDLVAKSLLRLIRKSRFCFYHHLDLEVVWFIEFTQVSLFLVVLAATLSVICWLFFWEVARPKQPWAEPSSHGLWIKMVLNFLPKLISFWSCWCGTKRQNFKFFVVWGWSRCLKTSASNLREYVDFGGWDCAEAKPCWVSRSSNEDTEEYRSSHLCSICLWIPTAWDSPHGSYIVATAF